MSWGCSSCGGENQDGMKFCGHCGTPAGAALPAGAETETRPSAEADVSEALKSFVSQQVADHLVASGGEITEERRLVTALFADLSGFTPLADRLDPEELLEVIDPIIERLTNIVGKYEGYVDKFAGDALMAFFGAPIAHEDDAHRALCVAMDMHEEIKNIRPELPPDAGDLTLHIGVNSGRVVARVLGTDVRMDYSVLGDAVILAQRLESAAPAGETYVGQTTHVLTSNVFEFEPIGELTLKGKAEPVSAFRLIGRRRRRDRERRGDFVGREQELEAIDAVLGSLTEGVGSVVSVSGEPGVGKSRFTEEVRRRAESQGAQWLIARCLSYGQGIAYWPIADLFRRVAGISQNDPPERALPRLEEALYLADLPTALPALARLLGLPTPELDALEPEAYRRLLHQTIADAVAHLSRSTPVVIAVEDLHWADASSVELITDLTRLCSTEPVMLYLTGRAEAMSVLLQIASGAAETLRHPIQLDALDAPVIGPLIEGVLGAPPAPRLTELINERAVGNPFFVRELVRSLQDTGDIVRSNGQWDLSTTFDATHVPPTIEGVLSARLDRLARPFTTTLQISSVIGRRVRIPLLAAVHPNRNLKAHLEGLVSGGFLDRSTEEDEELVFHHALVQDVAYSRLLRKRRRELHQKVAEEAERLYGAGDDSIDLLARHLHLAEAGDKAIEYLIRAGERAKRLFANDEALIHFGHALDLAGKDEQRRERTATISINLGEIEELRGEYDSAFQHYRRARDLSDSSRAWRGMAATLRNRGKYDEALALLAEALEQGFEGVEAAQLYLERGWVFSRLGDFQRSEEVLTTGLKCLGPVRRSVAAELLLQLARAKAITGRPEEGLADALSAMGLFEETNDLPGLSRACRVAGAAYEELERLDEAAETLRRGLQLAHRTGNAEELAGCLVNLGLVELSRGNVEEAIGCDEQAIAQFERIGIVTGQAIGYGNLAEKLVVAGRHLEALEKCSRALDLARSIGDLETVADVTKTVAMARRVQGNLEEAIATAEEAANLYLEMGAVPYAREALILAAEVMEQVGDEERARSTKEQARSLI